MHDARNSRPLGLRFFLGVLLCLVGSSFDALGACSCSFAWIKPAAGLAVNPGWTAYNASFQVYKTYSHLGAGGVECDNGSGSAEESKQTQNLRNPVAETLPLESKDLRCAKCHCWLTEDGRCLNTVAGVHLELALV